MINKITVSEKRGLFPEYANLGTIGEQNATTLLFLLPETLQGYSENIVCETAQGSFNYEISNDTFDLPSEVLTGSTLKLQLVLKDGDQVIWKSISYKFTLNPTLDDSGINVIDTAKAEQRETDRTELAGVVTDLTGEDYTTSEWNELLNATAKLPVKTEQDVVDLTGYSALTNAFRQSTSAPSLLTGGYNLDKDESDEDILIKLPYLYTPNVKYSDKTLISSSVIECGFDVSAAGETLCHDAEISMFNRSNSARNLVKLKLTGLECVKYGATMFQGMPALTELEIVEGENYAESYASNYYYAFFKNCTRLEAIKGTPLDMSRGTTYGAMFYNCSSLRYVRFKTGTICRDLDLSYCPALIKKYEATTDDPGTLLSIINGVRDYTGAEDPITIKFSTFVKSYLSSWRCTIDEQTGLYVYSDRNSDNTMWTILTTAKGVVIS